MDIIFKNYKSSIEQYDDIVLKSSNLFMELQGLLTNFIKDVLNKVDSFRIDVDLNFPIFINGKYENVSSKSIYIEEETGYILVDFNDSSLKYNWHDLTVTVQDLIVNRIHIDIKTFDMHNQIFMN